MKTYRRVWIVDPQPSFSVITSMTRSEQKCIHHLELRELCRWFKNTLRCSDSSKVIFPIARIDWHLICIDVHAIWVLVIDCHNWLVVTLSCRVPESKFDKSISFFGFVDWLLKVLRNNFASILIIVKYVDAFLFQHDCEVVKDFNTYVGTLKGIEYELTFNWLFEWISPVSRHWVLPRCRFRCIILFNEEHWVSIHRVKSFKRSFYHRCLNVRELNFTDDTFF